MFDSATESRKCAREEGKYSLAATNLSASKSVHERRHWIRYLAVCLVLGFSFMASHWRLKYLFWSYC